MSTVYMYMQEEYMAVSRLAHVSWYVCYVLAIHTCLHENHNSLGCKQPPGLDIHQSPNAHATQMAGLKSPHVCAVLHDVYVIFWCHDLQRYCFFIHVVTYTEVNQLSCLDVSVCRSLVLNKDTEYQSSGPHGTSD